ncbi:hypothetical protein JKP88DRAFT_308587 [Tribonema minus]|uniref:Uncharacterized protein n=1 Tax=Tribonema minus TaxID=303371 RepID=A0A835Z4I0_9STRA|nr:hypothetical protein JKP88DRAFT_308587 [Tribonema minus]
MPPKKGKAGGKGKPKRDRTQPYLRVEQGQYVLRPPPERRVAEMKALQEKFEEASARADALGPCETPFAGDSLVMVSTVDGESELASVWVFMGQPTFPAGAHREVSDLANEMRGTRNLIVCMGFHAQRGLLPKTLVKRGLLRKTLVKFIVCMGFHAQRRLLPKTLVKRELLPRMLVKVSAMEQQDLDIIERDLCDDPCLMQEVLGWVKDQWVPAKTTPAQPIFAKVTCTLALQLLSECDAVPMQLMQRANDAYRRVQAATGAELDHLNDVEIPQVIEAMNAVGYSEEVWDGLQGLFTRAQAERAAVADGAAPGLTLAQIDEALAAAAQPRSRDAACAAEPLLRAWRNRALAATFAAARHSARVAMARAQLGQSGAAEARDRATAGALWGAGDA